MTNREESNPKRGAELRIICQQGLEQAAEMLSRLLAQPVGVEVSEILATDRQLPKGQSAEPGIGIYLALSGDLAAGLLLFFSEAGANWLSCQLLRCSSLDDLLSEPGSSTLKEVGNILASAFLASLDNQYCLRALPSPPQLSRARLTTLLGQLQPEASERCLIVRTRLVCAEQPADPLQGTLYLLLEPKSLTLLLDKLDIDPC